MTDMDALMAAADALADAVKPIADRLDRLETISAAKYAVATDIEIEHLWRARAALTAYRAAREAVTRGTPQDARVKALVEALRDMRRQFSPYPSEDTERWREEHEACEAADAAFDTTGGRTVYEPYPGAFDDILGPDTRGKDE